jgi:hypothetical protein
MPGKAREDIEFVQGHMQNGPEIAKRLTAHFHLANGNFSAAHSELDKVREPSSMDILLRARVFEMEAGDVVTPLAKREELIRRAEELRASHRFTTDLDVSFLV